MELLPSVRDKTIISGKVIEIREIRTQLFDIIVAIKTVKNSYQNKITNHIT